MGALHQGHAALIRAARKQGGRVLVSVFVNPLQFAPNEDFARYPRRLQDDYALALEAGADALWAPQIEDLFPAGAAGLTQLAPASELVANLCGPSRPGHFRGWSPAHGCQKARCGGRPSSCRGDKSHHWR